MGQLFSIIGIEQNLNPQPGRDTARPSRQRLLPFLYEFCGSSPYGWGATSYIKCSIARCPTAGLPGLTSTCGKSADSTGIHDIASVPKNLASTAGRTGRAT